MHARAGSVKTRDFSLLFIAFVAALVALSGAGIDASPALAKPTHLISVGARSFRCQCDPTAVDLNFSGECRRPSNGTTMLSVACSALTNNCVCTEIVQLVRRGLGCEPFVRTDQNGGADAAKAFNKALDEINASLGRARIDDQPLTSDAFSSATVKADSTGDAIFLQMQKELKVPKVDVVAKQDSIARTISELSPRINDAIAKGCKTLGECQFFSVSENRAVEVVERGPDGDFRVDLELTSVPLDLDNFPTTGVVELELRTIFEDGSSGFKLEEKLGQGSFGIVFKATVEGGSEVAIKFVRTDRFEDMLHDVKINNEMLRIFGNTQYESLFSLPQGMLKIKRKDQDDQVAFLFDKMDGDVYNYMKLDVPRDFNFLRTIGSTMFHGVRAMEKAGMLHSDIKLENVLYTQAKGNQPASARLADFGLSRRFINARTFSKPRGTLGYAAPEMLIDFKQSSKSDVWAAGVTLFTAAVGHHPFGNSPKDMKDIYRGYHRLLGEGTLPREFKEIVGNLPNPIPIKEYLAGTITRNEEVEMSAGKRLQLAHLLENIFVADPAKRVSPEGAANHPFFTLQDSF